MEKKDKSKDTLDLLRSHLRSMELLSRLLLVAAAFGEFTIKGEDIGHLASWILYFCNRHKEILAREGV